MCQHTYPFVYTHAHTYVHVHNTTTHTTHTLHTHAHTRSSLLSVPLHLPNTCACIPNTHTHTLFLLFLALCHSRSRTRSISLDGYCSTVQGLLDWFQVDLGFTELLFIQIDLCVMCVFVLYSPVSLSSCPFPRSVTRALALAPSCVLWLNHAYCPGNRGLPRCCVTHILFHSCVI